VLNSIITDYQDRGYHDREHLARKTVGLKVGGRAELIEAIRVAKGGAGCLRLHPGLEAKRHHIQFAVNWNPEDQDLGEPCGQGVRLACKRIVSLEETRHFYRTSNLFERSGR